MTKGGEDVDVELAMGARRRTPPLTTVKDPIERAMRQRGESIVSRARRKLPWMTEGEI